MSDFTRSDIANLTAGDECNRRTYAAASRYLVPWPQQSWPDRLRRDIGIPNPLPGGWPVYADVAPPGLDVPDMSNDSYITSTRAVATSMGVTYTSGDSALTICKNIQYKYWDFLYPSE